MIKFLCLLLASSLSGVLYRLGGKGKPYNTKYRDLGCPTIAIALIWLLTGKFSITYVISFGLMFGALTTYWDKLFGYDNFWFHGFMCGLAGIPLIWCGVPIWIVISRIVICSVGMGLVSKFIGNDVLEEFGRGVFFIL